MGAEEEAVAAMHGKIDCAGSGVSLFFRKCPSILFSSSVLLRPERFDLSRCRATRVVPCVTLDAGAGSRRRRRWWRRDDQGCGGDGGAGAIPQLPAMLVLLQLRRLCLVAASIEVGTLRSRKDRGGRCPAGRRHDGSVGEVARGAQRVPAKQRKRQRVTIARILERSMACCSMRPDPGSLSDGGVARKQAGGGQILCLSLFL
jgi:hypothetical protein